MTQTVPELELSDLEGQFQFTNSVCDVPNIDLSIVSIGAGGHLSAATTQPGSPVNGLQPLQTTILEASADLLDSSDPAGSDVGQCLGRQVMQSTSTAAPISSVSTIVTICNNPIQHLDPRDTKTMV